MWIPEREQREIKAEDIFKEMIAENFPKLMADSKGHIQEFQRPTNQDISPKDYT